MSIKKVALTLCTVLAFGFAAQATAETVTPTPVRTDMKHQAQKQIKSMKMDQIKDIKSCKGAGGTWTHATKGSNGIPAKAGFCN